VQSPSWRRSNCGAGSEDWEIHRCVLSIGRCPAGRALGLQKSKLSRSILREGSDGACVCLTDRPAAFRWPGIFREFCDRCVAMLLEAEAAEQPYPKGFSGGIDAHGACLRLPSREARVAAQMAQAIAVAARWILPPTARGIAFARPRQNGTRREGCWDAARGRCGARIAPRTRGTVLAVDDRPTVVAETT
jgi:hypothetical protein